MTLTFITSRADRDIIGKIAERAYQMGRLVGARRTRMDWEMDITATHASGCSLELGSLLVADDFNFAHDVFGIMRHLNRDTGELMDCFVPRFARTDDWPTIEDPRPAPDTTLA